MDSIEARLSYETSFAINFIAEKIQIKDQIRALQPDIIMVVAYAQIIPKDILDIPKYGCLNIHGSLLPKYRGSAVIQAPLLNGDHETGITIMLMDEHLDTGPILRQIKIKIEPEETAQSLSNKLAKLGGNLSTTTIKDYLAGKIKPQAQNENQSNYVKKITKADGLIDWSKSAIEIERFVRAMNIWPSAWTWIKGKQLKIVKVQHQVIPINSQKIGKTFLYNKGLAVQCGQDALIVEKLQMEGKKELTSQEFLNGNKDFVGSILG